MGTLKLYGDLKNGKKAPVITNPVRDMPLSLRWEAPNIPWGQLWKSPCPDEAYIPEQKDNQQINKDIYNVPNVTCQT